jgi:hypothetical protein
LTTFPVYHHGIQELSEQERTFKNLVKPGDVVVDVGANCDCTYESKVLAGSQRIIECHHPYFVIDLHTRADMSVAHLLTSYGYKLSRLCGSPILRTDKGWPDVNGVWGTILATPGS